MALDGRTLQGQRALVTGCSSGIGRATAMALAWAGAEVFATARDRADLDVLQRVDDEHKLELDVTDEAEVERAVRLAGPLDVLVNNAGYGLTGVVEEIADEELAQQYAVNVFGPWRLCRLALPGMRERGRGTIVNISSYGGEMPYPGIGAYRSSKAALEAMTATLHLEVASFGIRVILLQPGLVDTDFAGRSSRVATAHAPAYGRVKSEAERAYARMSPGPGLPADAVADAIVRELRRGSGPLRVAVGDDARRNLAAVRAGQAAFERYLDTELKLAWRMQ
jgi:NAD(P)-dependent dehydrogenase (short-subunit alcohol dehydrogenase family)